MNSTSCTTIAWSFILWVALLIVGCTSNLKSGVESEPGQGFHQDQLVARIGEPDERTSLPEGGEQLVFNHTVSQPSSESESTSTCRLVFQTDAQGFIRHVSSTGCDSAFSEKPSRLSGQALTNDCDRIINQVPCWGVVP